MDHEFYVLVLYNLSHTCFVLISVECHDFASSQVWYSGKWIGEGCGRGVTVALQDARQSDLAWALKNGAAVHPLSGI